MIEGMVMPSTVHCVVRHTVGGTVMSHTMIFKSVVENSLLVIIRNA